MVSSTQQTERRRRIRARKGGQVGKRLRAKVGTPPFPVQPEGYDPSAPDAKPESRKTPRSSDPTG